MGRAFALKKLYYEQNSQQGYVKDGLELWLDGIDNTRAGHSTTTAVWEDLSGHGRDWTLNSGIVINENNIAKSNSSILYIASINSPNFFGSELYSGHTVEIVVKPLTTGDGCFFISNAEAKKGLMQFSGYVLTGADVYSQFDFENSASDAVAQYSIVYGLSLSDSYAYKNSILQDKRHNSYISGPNGHSYLGGRSGGSVMYCAIHSFRVYSRPLTAEEVAHNYAIDKARFNIPDATA